jgi:hypothetical protein
MLYSSKYSPDDEFANRFDEDQAAKELKHFLDWNRLPTRPAASLRERLVDLPVLGEVNLSARLGKRALQR